MGQVSLALVWISSNLNSQVRAWPAAVAKPARAVAVVCRAQQQQQAKAALASVPALLAASPAFALVRKATLGSAELEGRRVCACCLHRTAQP
jgi:hypothetical protein